MPLWLSFTLHDDNKVRGHPEPSLRSGETVAEAVRVAVEKLDAAAVLFNCSQPEVMMAAVTVASRLITDSRRSGDVRVGVYANAFPPQDESKAQANSSLLEIREDLDPKNYLNNFARGWHAAGASVIGGCCGIGPEHIEALRQGL